MTRREMIEKRQLELVQWYQAGQLVPFKARERIGVKHGSINLFDWAHTQAIHDVDAYLNRSRARKGQVA